MNSKNQKRSFWEKLRRRYQFNVMNQDNFEVRSVMSLSALRISVLVFVLVILLSMIIFLAIAFTPLKQYIPGYGKIDERQMALKHQLMVDSMLIKFEQNNTKLGILEKVLSGDFDTMIQAEDLLTNNYDSLVIFSESMEDSILRAEVELRERFSIFDDDPVQVSISGYNFYPPIKGILSDSFDSDEAHIGIDIVAGKNLDVKSVLDGIVMFAEFSIESGYILGIYHVGDVISIYKHNKRILKSVGDQVKRGEVVAVAGNTGELTSGPHLHFELWYEGEAVDPLKYINLE